MKINNIKWITGSLMTAALAAGISACTDDHFDISSAAAGKQTVWQNIQLNSDKLSEFADILQSVYYSQTEEKTTPETYADLLNGDQTFTVWAPVNGSFDYSYYKGLIETGIRDSIYKVEKELIRNNMNRYSTAVNGTDTAVIKLYNSKGATLDFDRLTIKDVNIQQPNIGAKNGVLHILEGPVPYQPNLYEYLATRRDLDSINTFIKSFQTTEFNEYASTLGPTVNGRITWVDSITYISNDYTTYYMGARLNADDSLYAMIIPTNTAWKETLAKTKKYFKFKETYEQDVNTQTEAGVDTLIKGKKTTFTQAELDSLLNFYAKNAICENLAFNAKWQYEQIPIATIADIMAVDERQDSLISTGGTKFKKTGTLNLTNGSSVVEVDNYTQMFGYADPVKVSNGYAYVTDQFNYPFHTYAPIIDENGIIAYESKDNACDPASGNKIYQEPTVIIDDETIECDSTFRYSFLRMQPIGNTHPGAFFKLFNVLSCKYDIYVVINYNTDYDLRNKFYVYISYDKEDKRENNIRLTNPDPEAMDASGEPLLGTNYFVNRGMHYNEKGEVDYTDTLLVAKDFEFPVCYYGISNNAYPVINIKSYFKSNERSLYCREIWVNSIILKPKEWTASSEEE